MKYFEQLSEIANAASCKQNRRHSTDANLKLAGEHFTLR